MTEHLIQTNKHAIVELIKGDIMKRIVVEIDDEQHRKLRQKVARMDTTLRAVFLKWLERWLQTEK